MKSDKGAGPSGIVIEMIKAAGDAGATMICNIATASIHNWLGSKLHVLSFQG